MARTLRLTVPRETGKIRLDKFLCQNLETAGTESGNTLENAMGNALEDPGDEDLCCDESRDRADSAGISREGIKKLIARGLCLVNGTACTQAAQKLKMGDSVELELAGEDSGLVPEEGAVTVLHEDADVLVCAKEAGLTVHPCPSCPANTLIQRLLFHYPELGAMGGLRPGIVHRLDKETSGLLIVARNEKARLFLTRAFAERRVRKIYLAIVAGKAPESGSCTMSIGRDPVHKTRMACVPVSQGGREARTTFERLWVAGDESASLVRVHIHTGRTHQIRVHMAHLGHPLLGDATYAPSPIAGLAPRVMLHAFSLTVPHPAGDRELSLTLPPPKDFLDCLVRQAFATQTLVVTGNPGSGKSLVLRMMVRQGIPAISADELVKGYYQAGGEVAQWLCQRFGSDILDEAGSVDRTGLMAVFARSPDVRREVEELCHRLVLGDIRDFFASCQQERRELAVAEIPLYFECGWHKGRFVPAPLTLEVRAPLATRKTRLAAARNWSNEKIATIEHWQWDEEKKLSACDLVLDNTGNREKLEHRLEEEILPELERRRRERATRITTFFHGLWQDAGTDRDERHKA